jgi:hypothetical protein
MHIYKYYYYHLSHPFDLSSALSQFLVKRLLICSVNAKTQLFSSKAANARPQLNTECSILTNMLLKYLPHSPHRKRIYRLPSNSRCMVSPVAWCYSLAGRSVYRALLRNEHSLLQIFLLNVLNNFHCFVSQRWATYNIHLYNSRYINSRYIKHACIRRQRCVKISKQSVKKFRRFKIFNKRTFTFLFI